ncbi:MAG: ABC transporter permease [Bacteroides sp.]|nr:ABC transporter permease [Prevotella sp.]MCM1407631.1 ABC transporter permease [Treponema brennaborense]MCM1469219.1 ABC transporter permease [Bacteroides sp.]
MRDVLEIFLPNVMRRLPVFGQAILDTIIMTAWSGIISFILGLVCGITITVTKEDAVLENKFVFRILDALINLFRSIPFIILLTGVMPLSRLIMGTAIGVRGAIVPLVFGTVPFFSRQIETALAEVDGGLIEAAVSMGLSPLDIIFRVYLRESVAPIVRGTAITLISLIGLTAMAGVVGAGGLGNYAIMYGHDRNQLDVTWVTIVILVAAVNIIQWFAGIIIKKHTH